MKSDWYFLSNQKLRAPITFLFSALLFVLTAIVTWEIEEHWSNSSIRDKITNSKEVDLIQTQFIDENNFNILLLPFGSSQSCNEETILCERELKKILISDDNDSDLEVKIDYSIQNKELIFTKEELSQLALNTKADLIIWGDYTKKCDFDSTLVQVNHFIPDNKDTELFTLDKFEISDYHPVSDLSELANGKVIGDIKNIYNWVIGLKEFNQQNFNRAINFLTKVKTTKSPLYAHLHHIVGFSYQNLNDFENGIDYYSKALEIDSTFEWSYNNRGNCWVNIEKYESALNDFIAFSRLTEGKVADVYLNIGYMHNVLGNKELAIENLNYAAGVFNKYGGKKDLGDLIQASIFVWVCTEESLEIGLNGFKQNQDDNSLILLQAKIICYIKNEEYDTALKIIEDRLNKNPEENKIIMLKAISLRLAGKIEEYKILRKKIEERNPEWKNRILRIDFFGEKFIL